jgi:hypothetical protein
MKKEFVECETEKEAWDLCPWASVIVKAEGGFMAFESWDDYNIWINQI